MTYSHYSYTRAQPKTKETLNESAVERAGEWVKGLSVWQIVDRRSISTIALTVAPRQRQQELPFILLVECVESLSCNLILALCVLSLHCLPLFLATVNPLVLTYVF